jgi:hypothetical protein
VALSIEDELELVRQVEFSKDRSEVISNGGFGHKQFFRDSLPVDTGRTESHDLAFTAVKLRFSRFPGPSLVLGKTAVRSRDKAAVISDRDNHAFPPALSPADFLAKLGFKEPGLTVRNNPKAR